MDLKTQIALQDTAWRELKITVPLLTQLMAEFAEFVSKDLPASPEDVPRFLADEFARFVQPSPGFYLGRTYSRKNIEAAFGSLTPEKEYLRDSRAGWYWVESESFEFGMNISSIMLVSTRKPK